MIRAKKAAQDKPETELDLQIRVVQVCSPAWTTKCKTTKQYSFFWPFYQTLGEGRKRQIDKLRLIYVQTVFKAGFPFEKVNFQLKMKIARIKFILFSRSARCKWLQKNAHKSPDTPSINKSR